MSAVNHLHGESDSDHEMVDEDDDKDEETEGDTFGKYVPRKASIKRTNSKGSPGFQTTKHTVDRRQSVGFQVTQMQKGTDSWSEKQLAVLRGTIAISLQSSYEKLIDRFLKAVKTVMIKTSKASL